MKSSLTLLGLIGGGIYFLSKKSSPSDKKSTEKKDTKKPNTNGGKPPINSDNEDLPNIDDEEDNDEDLPNVNDEQDTGYTDEQQKENCELLMKEYYDPYLVINEWCPANIDEKQIWISNDCTNWGIRKGYDFSLPEKYLYPDPVNPDKLTTPAQYWDKVGSTLSPAPIYIANLPMDTPHAAIAANIFDYFSPCDISPPRRKQFNTYGEYKIVRTKFAETPLGKLFEYINDRVKKLMLASWDKKYPGDAEKGTGAAGETLKAWAMWAIKTNPNLSNFTKLTDIAYAELAKDAGFPKKLNPENPDHKPYVNVWTRLNIEVKNYKGLIKQWGLD